MAFRGVRRRVFKLDMAFNYFCGGVISSLRAVNPLLRLHFHNSQSISETAPFHKSSDDAPHILIETEMSALRRFYLRPLPYPQHPHSTGIPLRSNEHMRKCCQNRLAGGTDGSANRVNLLVAGV